MTSARETVRDRETWDLLQEVDQHGENLTQWEIDFVEQLTRDLLCGATASAGRKAKLAQIREDRLP